MPSPRPRLDPQGYYARLGLDPAATQADVTAAFRRLARQLHPDIPVTGDTNAFVAVRQAYDVLSDPLRRVAYDRAGHEAVAAAQAARAAATAEAAVIDPDWYVPQPRPRRPSQAPTERLVRGRRFADVPLALWLGLSAFLCLCAYQAVVHLRSAVPLASAGIRPNAAPVEPLSASAQRAFLYGPAPVRLAGTPNYYVIPAAGPTVLWRQEPGRDAFVPVGELPPFSAVQAIRVLRQSSLVEVLYNAQMNGFIDAKRLTPGDVAAARRGYCAYNAGPIPLDGEILERHDSGRGTGSITLENRAVQPAVVKLRDGSGAVARSVFLAPAGHVELEGMPDGPVRLDFAVGELWSRVCNTFAAGLRAQRMRQPLVMPDKIRLVVPPENPGAAADIQDAVFEHD